MHILTVYAEYIYSEYISRCKYIGMYKYTYTHMHVHINLHISVHIY